MTKFEENALVLLGSIAGNVACIFSILANATDPDNPHSKEIYADSMSLIAEVWASCGIKSPMDS